MKDGYNDLGREGCDGLQHQLVGVEVGEKAQAREQDSREINNSSLVLTARQKWSQLAESHK